LKSKFSRMVAIRKRLLDRFTAAGNPYPDSCMEAIWFNSGTLGFYPEKALAHLAADPALRAAIEPEIEAAPTERPKMQALMMEMMRLHSRIASVNYLVDGKPTFALIATAVLDPVRFPDPEKVDLTRDHSDSVSFALPSPHRSCPGAALAPEVMAAVLSHLLRQAAARPLEVA
jgi:cytochrome P450